MASPLYLVKEAKRKQELSFPLRYCSLYPTNSATLSMVKEYCHSLNLFILGLRRDKKCGGQVISMILPAAMHALVSPLPVWGKDLWLASNQQNIQRWHNVTSMFTTYYGRLCLATRLSSLSLSPAGFQEGNSPDPTATGKWILSTTWGNLKWILS